MVTRIASIAISLTLVLAAANAATPCATSTDIDAQRVSALQQHLMVAALTCHRTTAYNRFVVEYRPELIEADRALLAYFRRTQGARGEEAYHTFKTELANAFSMKSLREPTFCAEAESLFTASLVDAVPPVEMADWQPEAEACPLEQAAAD